MKITGVSTMILKKEVKNPVSDALHVYDVGGHLYTVVTTDEGVTGYGLTYFGRIDSGMETVRLIVEKNLAAVVTGKDPYFVRELRNDMFVATEYYGTVGVASFAIAAVENAIWDILGKKAGLPVGKLLGARRSAIPGYAMVGWYYEGGLSEFVRRCVDVAEEGFTAVKLKVGRDSLSDDLIRIRAVHKELGDDFRVMVDANCAYDEAEAVYRGAAYAAEGVYWFEEPLQPYMRDSYVRLREKVNVPIAIGENIYTRHQFYDIIKSGGVSIVQPDGRRAGGITEWLDIGAISEAAGLTLASHGGGPAAVNILCAIENAIYIESGSLKGGNSMMKAKTALKDGALCLPEEPGLGTEVSEDYIERYRVDNR